jgi:hypothetical protein
VPGPNPSLPVPRLVSPVDKMRQNVSFAGPPCLFLSYLTHNMSFPVPRWTTRENSVQGTDKSNGYDDLGGFTRVRTWPDWTAKCLKMSQNVSGLSAFQNKRPGICLSNTQPELKTPTDTPSVFGARVRASSGRLSFVLNRARTNVRRLQPLTTVPRSARRTSGQPLSLSAG